MFSWICSKCRRTVWNCKTCKCGNTYKDISSVLIYVAVFLKCMENFIRDREQEAVKKIWEEIADCLDLPITEESAVIILDKKKVDEVLKKYGG